MHPQDLAPCSNRQPTRGATAENRSVSRPATVANTPAPDTAPVMQLSRSEDRRRVWSCIPVVNLMQLRAANDGGTCHQQPKGDVYEVREHCESGGCRSRGGRVCRFFRKQTHPGGIGRTANPSGQSSEVS